MKTMEYKTIIVVPDDYPCEKVAVGGVVCDTMSVSEFNENERRLRAEIPSEAQILTAKVMGILSNIDLPVKTVERLKAALPPIYWA